MFCIGGVTPPRRCGTRLSSPSHSVRASSGFDEASGGIRTRRARGALGRRRTAPKAATTRNCGATLRPTALEGFVGLGILYRSDVDNETRRERCTARMSSATGDGAVS